LTAVAMVLDHHGVDPNPARGWRRIGEAGLKEAQGHRHGGSDALA
jgi:hypothetical protein